jgi:O-antigen ligase
MFRDHPIFGVGLDNFLYEYRGRYIFDAAWQEPNLSHPHNIILDFATRLGFLGLLTGFLMIWTYIRLAINLLKKNTGQFQPLVVGIVGSLVYMLSHGIVDHSFFLIDLAYIFMFQMGILVLLSEHQNNRKAKA